MKHRRQMSIGRRDRGAVLIIALIMLLLITMVSMAAVRVSTMDERMAGNARDRDKALQAAEAAVRVCLDQLLTTPPTFASTGGVILTPVAAGNREHWENAWDATNSKEITVPGGTALEGSLLSSPPRCMVEQLGTGGGNYRVTGRAVGGSDSSVVIIQATYSAEY